MVTAGVQSCMQKVLMYIIWAPTLPFCFSKEGAVLTRYSSCSLAELAMSLDYFDPGPDAAYYTWINSLIDLSAAVMLYYDYLLTLHREIQFLWPPHNKQGWFTLACFLNRYLPIIGLMPITASYFIPVNPQVCEGLHTYHEWFVMVIQTHAGTLCLLRVYALYGRSRRILGFLLFLGTGSVVTALASLFSSRKAGGETIPVISPFVGCSQYTPHKGGRFAAIAWTGVLVFDGLIFLLTLYKAFTIGRGVKLLYVIVRDGTMYFSALSFMNLGNIMTLRFSPPMLKTSTTTFTNVLSTTLVTRLVLNLRERAVEQLPTTVETVGRFQAALPVAQQPLSVISVRRQNRSAVTATATREMVTSVAIGDSRSQQFRSTDVIEYETVRGSQVTLSVGRQQPATSAHVRSLSSIRQNRSMGETVSVGTTTGADAIGHETERKFQTAWLVSQQPMASSFIPTSVRPNRSTGETASVGTAGASTSQLQSADDATSSREEGSQSK